MRSTRHLCLCAANKSVIKLKSQIRTFPRVQAAFGSKPSVAYASVGKVKKKKNYQNSS